YIYIWGAYHGYDDGTTNDPTQRFVSRLYGLNVGVPESELAPLQLQPNPTFGPLSVTLPANTAALHAEVLDANGRMVWSKALSAHSEQLQLDLSALSEGAYVLRLRLGDGSVRNGRFVILR
ncbi:MAG: T9SS type A sorting domain-containing protein, partial [Flavobacteriales bacterium]